jgi:hypothetical protein
VKKSVAQTVAATFLEGPPDAVTRFGDRARLAGIEDAHFHAQFPTAAIERDSRPRVAAPASPVIDDGAVVRETRTLSR